MHDAVDQGGGEAPLLPWAVGSEEPQAGRSKLFTVGLDEPLRGQLRGGVEAGTVRAIVFCPGTLTPAVDRTARSKDEAGRPGAAGVIEQALRAAGVDLEEGPGAARKGYVGLGQMHDGIEASREALDRQRRHR